ncbi:hypothetical protein GKZ90_0020810 [Flavobacterium sp. MC2016-06]|uniref:hypothetical protein n=1 Tax=Flavobacterium sp. MC2016-06 TaxID=2676308 RepID=UPI0012BAF7CF|nr:hypothetical protein [Flavobacterium sp. MC2016-06]MBU3860791.1 hypothetical protein [Flavobacterium sp. MC2016-06]
MNRAETRQQMELEEFRYNQDIKKSLAAKLGLPELNNGLNIIRNEKGLRENEKKIEYIWIAFVARSFVGWGGIFSIKFEGNNFREYLNPDELMQGVFTHDNKGLKDLYTETVQNKSDKIVEMSKFDLFTAVQGNTGHGIHYDFHVITNNINTRIKLENPNTEEWKEWEKEIFNIGSRLSFSANIPELINVFKSDILK